MNQFLIQGAIITGIAGFLGSLTAIGMAFANLINARAQQVVTHAELARQQQKLSDVAATQTAMQVAQTTQPPAPVIVTVPAPAPSPNPPATAPE